MTVLTTAGKAIDWNKPPKSTDRVHWSEKTTGGKVVQGSLRTIAHLDSLDSAAKAKGWSSGIAVIQSSYNSTVAASAGTHDYDACVDLYIPGAGWRDAEKWLRSKGFACWYRFPPKFGYHIHGFTLPPHTADVSQGFAHEGTKVGIYVDGGVSLHGHATTSSQIADYYNHAFGLAGQHGKNSDGAWYPANIAATAFDLNAYIKARAWKPNPETKSTLAVIQRQFQKRDPAKKYNGTGLIQAALNKHGAALAVDGIAGAQTIAAWNKYEAGLPASQRSGKTSTPDPKSLHTLGLSRLFVGPEAK